MKQTLIDTDILSMFFRSNKKVIYRFEEYAAIHIKINLSIITYYEILSGLKHRDANKQLSSFLRFASQNNIIPLTEQSVTAASDIYAETRAKGAPIDDIDILIAGIAVANDLVLVTHNRKHFDRIQGLEIVDWND